MKKKDNEIGVLWKKTSQNGNEYFSGVVNGEKITVFKNYNKSKDMHPDFIILKQEKSQTNQTPSTKTMNENAKKINSVFNDDDDTIPF